MQQYVRLIEKGWHEPRVIGGHDNEGATEVVPHRAAGAAQPHFSTSAEGSILDHASEGLSKQTCGEGTSEVLGTRLLDWYSSFRREKCRRSP